MISRPVIDRAVLDAGIEVASVFCIRALAKAHLDAKIVNGSAEHIILDFSPELRGLRIGGPVGLIVGYADFTVINCTVNSPAFVVNS
ncbi:MAG: hypothetical protein AABP62_15145 [Planctomycetota bacterium]